MTKTSIAILTHNAPDRATALKYCLGNLITYSNLRNFDIHLFLDGVNPEIEEVVMQYFKKQWTENFANCFNVHVNIDEPNGCGQSMNWVWETTKEYEYTLMLEGDWILIPSVHANWLNDLQTFMDNNADVSTFMLRHFMNPLECRQFCPKYVNPHLIECGATMVFGGDIKDIELRRNCNYTNNPHLRRNKMYETLFPLDVSFGKDVKGTEHWGAPEIKAESFLNDHLVAYDGLGLFVHYEFVVGGYVDKDNLKVYSTAISKIATVKCPYSENECVFKFNLIDKPWCEHGCNKCGNKNIVDIDECFIDYLRKSNKL